MDENKRTPSEFREEKGRENERTVDNINVKNS